MTFFPEIGDRSARSLCKALAAPKEQITLNNILKLGFSEKKIHHLDATLGGQDIQKLYSKYLENKKNQEETNLNNLSRDLLDLIGKNRAYLEKMFPEIGSWSAQILCSALKKHHRDITVQILLSEGFPEKEINAWTATINKVKVSTLYENSQIQSKEIPK